MDERLQECIREVILLSAFKSFCEMHEGADARKRLRNIYHCTPDPISTTRNIIEKTLDEALSKQDAQRMYPWICAFLKKSRHRKPVADDVKSALLEKQKETCAICGCKIHVDAHIDHIIAFQYVGDELADNYQVLCSTCNLRKKASIDYRIRYLLKSI